MCGQRGAEGNRVGQGKGWWKYMNAIPRPSLQFLSRCFLADSDVFSVQIMHHMISFITSTTLIQLSLFFGDSDVIFVI